MEVQITQEGKVTTAALIGRLDTLAAQEIAPQMDALKEVDGTLVLDCKELSYISSSGLRIFLTLRKAAIANGAKIIVRGICPDIRNVFVMTGFLNLFEIED
ncbi:MAG: STAS domain-containing protein [Bacteroidota bacterium]|nr:STAS domain-containing protein [Bacteroidota bacterium]